MHELLTPQQMGKADRAAIDTGLSGFDLMRNAGRAVADCVALQAAPPGPILVLIGTGNNGGDGLIAAHYLQDLGFEVDVRLVGEESRIRGDARQAADVWGRPLAAFDPSLVDGCAIIVDALFGAGLDRDISGEAGSAIAAVNRSGKPVIAVDLPSGIDGRTGAVRGDAIRADTTVTFFRRKPGHLLFPGRAHCGTVQLAQIGILPEILDRLSIDHFANEPALWQRLFPRPQRDGHKYQRGHTLVLSGGPASTGAARLAAGAALRAGSGLVTLAGPKQSLPINAAHLTAIMLAIIESPDDLAALLDDKRIVCLLLGPGMGVGGKTAALVETALSAGRNCVLDADALTSFAEEPARLFRAIEESGSKVVMTPHAGEFSRLFDGKTGNAPQDRPDAARTAARMSGAIVILKGADTVIASPGGRVAINANAPPFLATAGAGDVLAGIAAGLLAQNMPAFEAAACAVWLHGEAANRVGQGLISEDLDGGLKAVLAAGF